VQNVLRQRRHSRVSEHVWAAQELLCRGAPERLEGIVRQAPRQVPTSRESQSRWLKIKGLFQQEVRHRRVHGAPRGRKYFGALIVGVYEDGRLTYTATLAPAHGADVKALYGGPQAPGPKGVPFEGTPPRANEKPAWVKPQLVCESSSPSGLATAGCASQSSSSLLCRSANRSRELAGDAAATGSRPSGQLGRRPPHPPCSIASTNGSTPSTTLSQAAARIAAQYGTKLRGATTAELEALDAIKKEGDWTIGGRQVHLTNLEEVCSRRTASPAGPGQVLRSGCPGLTPLQSPAAVMNPHPDGIHGRSTG